MISLKKNWLQAQNYCRTIHTDLASGLNQLKEPALKNQISSESSWLFMGLFRDAWGWSDRSQFSFRHWDLESFKDKPREKKCAMTMFSKSGKWGSTDCNINKSFVCYDGEFCKDPSWPLQSGAHIYV